MATQTIAGSPLPVAPGLGLTLNDIWSITISSAIGANAVTVSKAAGAAGVKHVALRLIVSMASGATVQPGIGFCVRDGATVTGPVLVVVALAQVANTVTSGPCCQNIDVPNIFLQGTAATAMTIESVTLGTGTPNLSANVASAATGAFSATLWGYDVQ